MLIVLQWAATTFSIHYRVSIETLSCNIYFVCCIYFFSVANAICMLLE